MQSIVFPSGSLLIKEIPGHDGEFVWAEASIWNEIAPIPALVVPPAVPPANIRTILCPECGHPDHFWALVTQLPHQCLACWHVFAVLPVALDRWAMVKPYLHEGNPWVHKSYKPVVPAYVGAPLYEESDDRGDEVDESTTSTTETVKITYATNTTNIQIMHVQASDGTIVWL